MTLDEYFGSYQARWFLQTRFEHKLMISWHAIINLLHCLPVWIEGSKIISHSKRLEDKGFVPTKFEEESLNDVTTLMIVSPFVVVLFVPLIQWGTLYLYYNYGHPWSRIFTHLKPPEQTKCQIKLPEKASLTPLNKE